MRAEFKLSHTHAAIVADRPVESHNGALENIIEGPITPSPVLYVLRSRHRRRREGGNVGRGVPSPSDYGFGVYPGPRWGSLRRSPSRVRGSAPADNEFDEYFRSEISHLEHHFQYF